MFREDRPQSSAKHPSSESRLSDGGHSPFARRVVLVFMVVAGTALLWNAPQTPFLILAAILFALLLDSMVGVAARLSGNRLPRPVSVMLALVILAAVTTGTVAFFGPRLAEQADTVREKLPMAVAQLRDQVDDFALGRALVKQAPTPAEVDAFLNGEPEDKPASEGEPGDKPASEGEPADKPASEGEPADKPASKGEPADKPASEGEPADKPASESPADEDASGIDFASVFTSTFGALVDLFVILVLGIYLAMSPRQYVDGVVRLIPPARRAASLETLNELGTLLKRWLVGRVVSMTVVALMTWGGLALVGVPYALTLGVIAGVLSFIPNLGPLIAMVPGVLLALLEGGSQLALVAFAVYVGVQVIESYVITPQVERQAVQVPPGLLILMQLVIGVLFGGLGLLLATPLTVVAVVATRRLYVEAVLEATAPEDAIILPPSALTP